MPNPIRQPRTTAWITLVTTVALTASVHAASPQPPSPAQWLVDYGLAYGERITNPQPHDAEYVLIWMQAASDTDPNLAEAHLWRYDLHKRLGHARAAHTALAKYRRANPRDLRAAFELLDLDLAAARTAEDRFAICVERLERPGNSREMTSDLHRRIAEIHHAQGDFSDALLQARKAVDLVNINLPAHQILALTERRGDKPRTLVELLLVELTTNPASFETRWRIADTLARFGLSQEAIAWYALTETAFIQQYPEAIIPTQLLLDFATAHAEAGNDDAAIAACHRARTIDPADPAAVLHLITIARDANRETLAETEANALAANLREREPRALKQRNATLCRHIARFHLDVRYDPQRALEFTRHADEFQPNHRANRVALGRALLETEDTQQAITTLTPVARDSATAALALARALRSLDRRDDAITVLREAVRQRYAGEAYRKIQSVLRELHAAPPSPPDPGTIRRALADFDLTLLDFPIAPASAIQFDVRLHHQALRLTEPIRADITLRNRANYIVTLGENKMIPPQIAVRVREPNQPQTERTAYLTLEFNQRMMLRPGEHTTQTVRLDTLATQALLFHQPQRRVEIEFAFILAPKTTDAGEVVSQLPGIEPLIQGFTRLPVDASPEGISQLETQLRGGTIDQRLAAIDTLLALIFERQESLQDEPHTYAAATVDPAQLTDMLHRALRDPDPRIRAHAAAAFTYLPLQSETINHAAPLLSDPHPLPRLLACELFAKKQGEQFKPVLQQLTRDPNPLIANLAACYQEKPKSKPRP